MKTSYTVETVKAAWEIVDRLFPTDYEEDARSTMNAGYKVYRSTRRASETDYYNYICDLGTVLEINICDENWNGYTIRVNIQPADEPKTLDTVKAVAAADPVAFRALRRELLDNTGILTNVYDGTRYGTPLDTVSEYVGRVGYPMAVIVIASLVNRRAAWDGRMSDDVKKWAARQANAYDEAAAERLEIRADSIHPAHLNQIAYELMNYKK